MRYLFLRASLAVGIAFFAVESVLHAFGLPILEHDKIWQITSDGYIAIMALTFAGLLTFAACNPEKYRQIFYFVMFGIALAILNGMYISANGGYSEFFSVKDLDANLRPIGIGSFIWYPLTWIAWSTRHKNIFSNSSPTTGETTPHHVPPSHLA